MGNVHSSETKQTDDNEEPNHNYITKEQFEYLKKYEYEAGLKEHEVIRLHQGIAAIHSWCKSLTDTISAAFLDKQDDQEFLTGLIARNGFYSETEIPVLFNHLKIQLSLYLATPFLNEEKKESEIIIYESNIVTYWLSRLLSQPIIHKGNIETKIITSNENTTRRSDKVDATLSASFINANISTFMENYQQLRSSCDFDECLLKIGFYITKKYEINLKNDDQVKLSANEAKGRDWWLIQIGLITLYKVWLRNHIVQGDSNGNKCKHFSNLLRLHYDLVLQKPSGRLNDKTDKRALGYSIAKTVFAIKEPKETISQNDSKNIENYESKTPLIFLQTERLLSYPSVCPDRFKLILLNRFIDVFFPILATNQTTTTALNKKAFIWFAQFFEKTVDAHLVDKKGNGFYKTAIQSYLNDNCKNKPIQYFGENFARFLEATQGIVEDEKSPTPTLLFINLKQALKTMNGQLTGAYSKQHENDFNMLLNFMYKSLTISSAEEKASSWTSNIKDHLIIAADELKSFSLLIDAINSWGGNNEYDWGKTHKEEFISALINKDPTYISQFHQVMRYKLEEDTPEIQRALRECFGMNYIIFKKSAAEILDELLNVDFEKYLMQSIELAKAYQEMTLILSGKKYWKKEKGTWDKNTEGKGPVLKCSQQATLELLVKSIQTLGAVDKNEEIKDVKKRLILTLINKGEPYINRFHESYKGLLQKVIKTFFQENYLEKSSFIDEDNLSSACFLELKNGILDGLIRWHSQYHWVRGEKENKKKDRQFECWNRHGKWQKNITLELSDFEKCLKPMEAFATLIRSIDVFENDQETENLLHLKKDHVPSLLIYLGGDVVQSFSSMYAELISEIRDHLRNQQLNTDVLLDKAFETLISQKNLEATL